ncbi:unnamed protein product [Penicillium salamii]|uniref:Cryptic loci regulator 2 N-terminal domain-containing protein n=1 Tax=Penicillium salamii TaxID=1612424 RepID=A0A9W4N7E6_9EURO|nr:unnamed protein product [Penicillium salamii]CAG8288361.1 unnamed protein product [Penicillium salamii]CAG8398952.1 unnamed protein product [Penicillium salamii]CAG8420280.1 unnamed protein product [Penicillium salamii]CAG8420819.1 unnamed protein product [Penicillium salamii]
MSSNDEEELDLNVIPVDSFASDGNMNTWPTGPPYKERDDQRWRAKLATYWLKEMGSLEDGASYTLDKLPEGYCLFEKPNMKNQRQFNPALFGHPSGRFFVSPNNFLEHFLSLIGSTLGTCKCSPCQSMSTAISGQARPGRKPGRPPRTSEQPNSRLPGDEDGPDYWKILVIKLKHQGQVDEEIKQSSNIDWFLTNEDLSDYFMKLVIDPAYVPRRGEIVLWIWSDLDGCLLLNPATGAIEVFGDDNQWHGPPEWRAGVVTQTPTDEVHMVDIVDNEATSQELSNSGFRVETLPDPLGKDKSYSRQYSYVPLRRIKPFNSWQNFLGALQREDVHPSIENAMTVMSSMSLVHKFHAKGQFPSLSISCKGIFIGAELLAVHDTIRLKPQGYKYNQYKVHGTGKVTDVMVIETITLELSNCVDNPDDAQLAQQYTALLTGKAFTTNPDRSICGGPFAKIDSKPLSSEEATATFRQVGMSDYGPWYPLADGKTCSVSPHHVIGRCYEPLAAELMFGKHTFGYDLSSVMEGRNYSEQVDHRMPVGHTWFWGDSRVETLGLTEINGVECGVSASQRETPEQWQALLKIARGEGNAKLRKIAAIPSSSGRPHGSKNKETPTSNSGFAGVASTSKMVSSAIGGVRLDSSNEDSEMTDDNAALELTDLMRAVKSDSEDEDYQ